MKDKEKILVALGLGEYSQGIFDFAASMAEGMGADLVVANIINSRDLEAVRVVTDMGYNVDGDHYISGVEQERKNSIEKILKACSLPLERIKILIKVGNPIEQLLDIITKEHVNMIVMGPKGRTDLEHVLLGSVAEKIFRRSPVTVISYRDKKFADKLRMREQLA